MTVRELAVGGAYAFTPAVHPDERGTFCASYTDSAFVAAVGHPLRLGQYHNSVSRRGTVRGVHFADVPPGQGKYVTCTRGSLLDVVVDLRAGSPTFGRWDSLVLDAEKCEGVYLAEGLGHAFMALEDNTVAAYLCSTEYTPAAEHEIDPFDPALGLPWPAGITPLVSDRDRGAPTLREALEAGALPDYDACLARYAALRNDSHTVTRTTPPTG
ncbi:dTDP-4-dehydrorhamnose 3,5-epimerase family protein [Streptomyces sp. NPDC050504]|uniref:dTDP-4-dehydrorhamnose 3,5-epimerase family protein n=1 Tax=Streptomyces sp. NPDC050504 TaxID=3365618 RepID=UPI00378F0DD5